jgi:membrane fusion protein, heavy metal efflux system
MKTRILAGLLGAAALALTVVPAAAHEGHDHGAPVPVDASWAPRATARSNDFDLVAVLAGTQLVVWLDRAADNAPVPKAQIEVEAGPWKGVATAAADGSYHLDAASLAEAGSHELVFTVQAGDAVDLLPATLVVPAAALVKAEGKGGIVGAGLGVLALVAALGWGFKRRMAGRAAS